MTRTNNHNVCGLAAQMLPLLLLASSRSAHAHGTFTIPGSRNGGDKNNPSHYEPSKWYTMNSRVSGPTWDDRGLRTEIRYDAGNHPWRSPGKGNIWSPCGNFCDNCQNANWNRDGRDLPETERYKWKAGSEVEVGWGMNTNHGGGYSYRLCKHSSNKDDISEECFQKGSLEFVGETLWIQDRGDENDRKATPATRYKSDTGYWTMNPVPNCDNNHRCPFPAPHSGVDGHNYGSLRWINVVDKVKVPADLAPGHYVLGWRWDCEETAQTFLNCADVEIEEGDPTPAPAPGEVGVGAATAGGGQPLFQLLNAQRTATHIIAMIILTVMLAFLR